MAEIVYVLSGEIAWFDLLRKYGDRFEMPFDESVELLKRNPELGPKFKVSPFRRLIILQTSWGIFYTIEGKRIMIQTILDLRQRPETIERRLRELRP